MSMVIPGFWHEQSRADRDSNVEIMWGNINPSMKYNFMKYSLTKITHLDAPYDTCSVMHYSGYAFSSVSPIFPIPEKELSSNVYSSSMSTKAGRQIIALMACSSVKVVTLVNHDGQ